MVSETDIYRAAKLLLKPHPDRARHEAKQRSSVLGSKGDREGQALWTKIGEAVEWLQSKDSPQDKTPH